MPMATTDGRLFWVEGVERHLFDGQRRTEIRLERLEMHAGQGYALCGPSGIGKTTALEMLSLARVPDVTGVMSLWSGGRAIDLNDLRRRNGEDAVAAIRAREFGYVVQTAHLFPFLTVRENIALAQQIAGRPDPAFVDVLMDRLQIRSVAEGLPPRLSGGQRQRACIARALAHRPSIILADEPTSAVDQEMADAIMELLAGVVADGQATLLVITHNTRLVDRFGLQPLDIRSTAANGLQQTWIGQGEDLSGRHQMAVGAEV